jgi:hypothetical protein
VSGLELAGVVVAVWLLLNVLFVVLLWWRPLRERGS